LWLTPLIFDLSLVKFGQSSAFEVPSERITTRRATGGPVATPYLYSGIANGTTAGLPFIPFL
jgi:hypothetical protein